jgi:nucleotide-binding universal stress UspA family protein
MFKHLLVPIDGSALSRSAASQAIIFAKAIGAQMTFFYARPDYPATFYGEATLIEPVTPDAFALAAQRQADQFLGECQERAAQSGVSSQGLSVVSDVPYQAIIDAATKAGCDMIFMASHGRRGFASLLLGSETHRVLAHSRIPVLVYR